MQRRLVEAGLLPRVIGGLLGEQVIDPVRVGGDATAGDQWMGVLLQQPGADVLLLAGQLAVQGKVAGQLGQQAADGRPHQHMQGGGREALLRLQVGLDDCLQQLAQRQVEVAQPGEGGQILVRLQRRQRTQQLVEGLPRGCPRRCGIAAGC